MRRKSTLAARTMLNEKKVIEIMDLPAKLDAIDGELWDAKRVVWSPVLIQAVRRIYRTRKREMPSRPIIQKEKPEQAEIAREQSWGKLEKSDIESSQNLTWRIEE